MSRLLLFALLWTPLMHGAAATYWSFRFIMTLETPVSELDWRKHRRNNQIQS